jgi:hypothetical protein
MGEVVVWFVVVEVKKVTGGSDVVMVVRLKWYYTWSCLRMM